MHREMYRGYTNWETWVTNHYFTEDFDEAAEEYFSKGGEDPSELEDIFSGIVEGESTYAGLEGFLKELVEAELEEIDYGDLVDSYYCRETSSVRSKSPRSRKAPVKKKSVAKPKTSAKKKPASKKARR